MAKILDYQDIIENLYDGLYLVTMDRKITYWNKAAEQITGFSGKEVVGKRCADNILIHIDDKGTKLCKGLCPLAATMNDGKSRESEFYLHHKKGYRMPVLVRTTPQFENGKIVGGIELFRDNSSTEKLRFEYNKLKQFSMLDFLTNIPNRQYVESQIQAQLQNARKHINFGLLFIDIDHFKLVNDNYGHDIGDEVLKIVAQTMLHSVRPFDSVCRWGGEEFASIHPNADTKLLESLAERFRILVRNSKVEVNGEEIHVTISVGGTISRENDTFKSIIKRVDDLMYRSKQEGRDRVTID